MSQFIATPDHKSGYLTLLLYTVYDSFLLLLIRQLFCCNDKFFVKYYQCGQIYLCSSDPLEQHKYSLIYFSIQNIWTQYNI